MRPGVGITGALSQQRIAPDQRRRTAKPHRNRAEQRDNTMKTQAEQAIKSRSAVAYALSEAGIAVFPCDPEDKRPLIRGGFKSATNDLDKVRDWWREFPDAIPGIPCGSLNGISVLDLDRKNGKNGFREMSKRGYDWKTLSAFTQETPSGGAHIYFGYLHGLKSSADKIASGVDVRSDGGYACFYGSAKDARTLSLFRDTIGLPEFPEELIPLSHEEIRIAPTGYSIEDVESALAAIPNNEDFDSRDDWCSIGFALHDATNGSREGWKRFLGWSKQHPSFNLEETQSFWRSAGRNPNRITARTLFAVARRYGWSDITPEDFEDDPSGDAIAMREFEDRQKRVVSHLSLMTPAQCAEFEPRPYIVKGLISEGEIGQIVAPPNVGKSLFAARLGYSIAQGQSVFGMKTEKGSVLYVAPEDEYGMRQRISALRLDSGEANNFHLVGNVSNLSPDKKDFHALKRLVASMKPKLVIIDTLRSGFPDVEENSSDGMAKVAAAMQGLARFGCAVLVVHHGGKTDDPRGRGSEALYGAADMSLHLTEAGEGMVEGKLQKVRNGRKDRSIAFTIETRDMGRDADGDPVEVPICVPMDDAAMLPRKTQPLAHGPATALEHLDRLRITTGKSQVDITTWRNSCMAELVDSDDRKMQQQAFRRAISALKDRKLITEKDGRFSLRNNSRPISREDFEDDFY